MPGFKEKIKHKKIKAIARGCLLGATALAVALVLHLAGWLDNIENKTWDWRVSVFADTQKTSGDIVVILLDQNSLDWAASNLGLTWPWPRQIYGILVDFCNRHQAKALAIDVIYSEPSTYGVADDELFKDALANFGHVTNAVVLGNFSGNQTHWPENIFSPRFEVQGIDSWFSRPPPS
ncbi:MAG: CHASE2 domain-containing protein [Desulfobacteraceae bacterium]|nr:CHASE2 domain-containing protein [Desulfobacteraceae bacterium]